MTDSDQEDSLTKLNTQLNKSMVLMEHLVKEKLHCNNEDKAIIINTSIQSDQSNPVLCHSRKSILKKTSKIKNGSKENSESKKASNDNRVNVSHKGSLMDSTLLQPSNIIDLMQQDTSIMTYQNMCEISTFTLDDISDSEDIWIMDIPKTIDPKELNGQTLILGEKTKLKLGNERYCTVNHNVKSGVTGVFNTRKDKPQFKTANIRPTGSITIRKKLSTIPKVKSVNIKTTGVPFPENLKVRHPFFGVNYKENVNTERKQITT